MEIVSQIQIDLLRPGYEPAIFAVQCESNSRVIKAKLMNGGRSFTIPDGVTAALNYRKNDGTSGFYNTLPDGSEAIAIEDDTVSVILAEQVLTCAGTVKATIVLTDANLNQLSSFPFSIIVSNNPAAGGTVSNNYYSYQTLGQINDGFDRLDQRISQALGAPLAFVCTPKTYIEQQGYVKEAPNENYITHRYRVFGSMEYIISGAGVSFPVTGYPLALFTQTPEYGKENTGTIIVVGSTEDTNFRTSYTPETDGYITIATFVGKNPLNVSVISRTGAPKIPLKIQIFGDSITNNYNEPVWPDFLQEMLPEYALAIVNSGKGGNTLTKYTVQPDGKTQWPSGTLVTEPVTKGVAYQILERAEDEAILEPFDPTADLYIISGGSNDYNSKVALGTFRDGIISTIHGATQLIIEHIQTQTDARILWVTPLQRYGTDDEARAGNGLVDDRGNILNKAGGNSLEEFANAVRDTCNAYGVPVVDFYRESGFSRYNIRFFANDGLHPNAEGARRLAKVIGGRIKQFF